ncbi:MAG: chemotaxis protein CheA [Betaproteobacteria bacterium]|nr:chemotaxis protein CheA [Betaproteobacteria bacterium]
MEDVLQDFLVEAGELLASVDNKLVELERSPRDRGLLNEIFRGFHTIKGGGGFLNATELVTLCHLTENLFDRLRNGELTVTSASMDVILAATGTVREMFGALEMGLQPHPAPPHVLAQLRSAIAGDLPAATSAPAGVTMMPPTSGVAAAAATAGPSGVSPDWEALYQAVTGTPAAAAAAPAHEAPPPARDSVPASGAASSPPGEHANLPPARRTTDSLHNFGGGGRREGERSHDTAIRVDISRLDQVLNLSGEIGLTKNRLTSLRTQILGGDHDNETLHALDVAVSQLDLLVSDLQNAVMKTRMQPVGRLFQKYPRIARDLARSLGKDVELVLAGEETEVDKTMIEDLADPIIHLVRNAVDHGVETQQERAASGKPAKSQVLLEARQEGDHIVITIADDGRGMDAERLRAKALQKGLISDEEANALDERQSFNLIFMAGFTTKDEVSDVSGRGVGMDVVRTNIQKLNGTIEVRSVPGKGSTFLISLPLTLAIAPVLIVRLGEQPFAVPLSLVREILPIKASEIQEIGGRATMVVRGEVLPVVLLNLLLGWPQERVPAFGVVMQMAEISFILAVDSFAGRDDAVIKSLEDFRPRGVAGVTTPGGERFGVPRSMMLEQFAMAA